MYKWNNPHEWVGWRAEQLYEAACGKNGYWAIRLLTHYVKFLAAGMSGDEIQDTFQTEMDESGYFMEDRNAE